MLIKITKDKLNIKQEIKDNCTLGELAAIIETKFSIHGYALDILTGYPPQLVQGRDATKVSDIGIKSGGLITLRDNNKKKSVFEGLRAMGFNDTVCGDALSLLDPENVSLDLAIDICTQIMQEDTGSAPKQRLVRRIIDADNSCLFNAVGYLVGGGEASFHTFDPMAYRKVIAETVLKDQETYTSDMLERPPLEYAAWIQNPEKWGGEIELFILSKYLGIEIVAVDVRTCNLLTYGSSDQAGCTETACRIYVIYDGVHYDAISREKRLYPPAPEVTKFASDDVETLNEVRALAQSLKDSKQFVNLRSGDLQCKVCFAVFAGEAAAVEHAKATGHQNFGQVE